MTVKTIKPSAAERKIKRLKAEIKAGKERQTALKRQFAEYRLGAGETLAKHLGIARQAEATLASNNMTITELNDQVAMQWKQRAESRSDVERATSLTAEAVAKHNKMVTHLRTALDDKLALTQTVSLLRSQAEEDREALAEAKRSLSNRTARLVASGYARVKAKSRALRTRLWNRWLIWRLNKARVSAMEEAGYIPSKLIKLAE